MMFRALVAAMALAIAVTAADARPRHHHRHHRHHAPASRALEAGQPPACAGIPWCGCWLRLRLGLADKALDAAISWLKIGRPARVCRPGLIAVWPHHVGEITECLAGGMIRMISGNDGNAVRDRVRPLGQARLREL